MALSKPSLLDNTTNNYARLSIVLLNVCTPLYRDLLRKFVPELSFYTVFTCEKDLPSRYRKRFFPISHSNPCKYDDFDIPLIYSLIRNSRKLTEHQSGWGNNPNASDKSIAAYVERLRIFRNEKYAHLSKAAVDDHEFGKLWVEIRNIVREIEDHLSPGVSKYADDVDRLENSPIDEELYERCVNQLKGIEKVADAVSRVEAGTEHMQEEISSLRRNVKTILRDFCDRNQQEEELYFMRRKSDFCNRIQQEEECYFMRRKSDISKENKEIVKVLVRNVSDKQSRMIASTRAYIESEMKANFSFVETGAYKKCYEKLQSNGRLLIRGLPGNGKTTIAVHIISKLMEKGKLPIQILNPKDWEEVVSVNENLIIFIDNIFGDYCVSSEFVEWKNRLKIIESNTAASSQFSNNLIMTLRTDIYKECQSKLNDDFLRNALVDISSETTIQDMRCIFSKYQPDQPETVIDDDQIEALLQLENVPKIGFPQCCKLFRDNQALYEKGIAFFENPSDYLNVEMENILGQKNIKAAILVFVLMKGGRVAESEIKDTKECTILKEEILDILLIDKRKVQEFRKHLEYLDGVFLKKDCTHYQFSHSSIQMALLSAVEKQNFKFLISKCDHSILRHFRSRNCPPCQTESFTIDKSDFISVFERIRDLVNTHNHQAYRVVAELPLWQDKSFFQSFAESDRMDDFILSVDEKKHSLIVHFAVAGNVEWVKCIMNKLKDGYQIYLALNFACNTGQDAVVKMLLDHENIIPDIMTYFHSVSGGKKSIIEMLFQKNKDIYKTSLSFHPKWSGISVTVFMEACLMRKSDLIGFLLEKDPDIYELEIESGERGMHFLAYSGEINYLTELLQKGCNPLIKNSKGETPLHFACKNGQREIAEYLIKVNPELINIQNDTTAVGTLLHSAAEGGNIEIFEYLIQKGKDASCFSKTGKSVLHSACANGKLEMFKFIIQKYPDMISKVTEEKETVAHACAFSGNVELFKAIENRGVDMETKRKDGKTILNLACLSGSFKMTTYILEKYEKLLYTSDQNEENLLHDAANGGNLDIYIILEKQNVNATRETKDGKTVLHVACRRANLELCIHILQKVPSLLNATDKYGNTVLHEAGSGGNVDVFLLLVQYRRNDFETKTKDGKTVLHLACINAKNEMSRYLVEKFPLLLDITDNNGFTALHDAAWGGNVDLLKFLVAKGKNEKDTTNNGETLLHLACRNGKTEISEYLVDKYPGLLDIRDNDGCTVLHDAGFGGNVDLFKFLVKKGKNEKDTTNNGKTVLHLACWNGNSKVSKYLVDQYPDLLDIRDNDGLTVLHEAAFGGNVDLFTFLVRNRKNENETTNNGETVLHLACRNGKTEMSKYLVDNYPDLLDIRDNDGYTVLHDAAFGGNVDGFTFLIEKGKNENDTTNNGETVLHLACRNGKTEMSKYLVDNYPDLLDIRDNDGYTMLHDAAFGGNVDVFTFLVQKGKNEKDTTNNGKTVLHLACWNGKTEMSKYLVGNYPDLLEIRDNRGCNVLHDAAWGGNVDLFTLLVKKGKSEEDTTNNGKTVLHLACRNGKNEMSKYLVAKYPVLLDIRDNRGSTVLHDAAFGGNVDLLEFLAEKVKNKKDKTNNGKTILHLACWNGKSIMSKYLVDKYPDLLNIKDNRGYTVLHDAAWGGNVDLFTFLVEKGKSEKEKSNNGETVLHLACRNGKTIMTKYLVDNYPDLLDIRDNDGYTVLHDAAIGGNIDLFTFLVKKSKNVEERTNIGKTVLHLACRNEETEMSKYLAAKYPVLMEIRDNDGYTMLHDAAWGGNVDLFTFLVEKGENEKDTTNNGETVLHLACRNAKIILSKFLVDKSPELLDIIDNDGYTVLHDAAIGGNIDLFTFLVMKGKNIKDTTNIGKTVLHLACWNEEKEMSKFLVDKYPDLLDIRDNDGHTVLHEGAWGGNIDLFAFLARKGKSENDTTNNGETVLHLACWNGKTEMSRYLVDKYPDLLDIRDNRGYTVLHNTAFSGNVDLFKFLVEKGNNEKDTTKNGKTVLHLACRNGKIKMSKYLVEEYPDLLDITDKRGYTVLHDAAFGGNVQLFTFLVEKGKNENEPTHNGKTVLHLACRNGKIELSKYLLNKYPDLLDITNKRGYNVLHEAAFGGNVDLYTFLVEKGKSEKDTTNNGKTVLHLACRNGKKEMALHLVDKFPDLLHIKDNDGYTVLHDAAFGENVDLLKFLVEKCKNERDTANNGKTVLHLACRNGKKEISKYLVDKYPDLLDIKDNRGHTVLHDAAWGGNVQLFTFLIEKGKSEMDTTHNGKTVLHLACRNGKTKISLYLVDKYPDLLDVRDHDGYTVLHDATLGENIDLLKFIAEKGMNMKDTTNNGKTVLHLACMNGKTEMSKYLLDKHSDLLDIRDNDGYTALHDAAFGGNIDLFISVTEKFKYERDTTTNGKTVLHLACKNGKTEMSKYLVDKYPDLLYIRDNYGHTVLHDTVLEENVNLFKFLVEKCKNEKEKTNNGKTLLHLACRNGKTEMGMYLMDKYPDFLDVRDYEGHTVLHDAAFGGNVDLFTFLVKRGTNTNETTKNGKSVLHLACRNGKLEISKYLFDKYPDLLDIRDNRGYTVLHDAAFGGNIELLTLLIEKGKSEKDTTKNGKTVLHLACRNGKKDMSKYLVENYPDLLDIRDKDGYSVLHDTALGENVDLFTFLVDKGKYEKDKTNNGKTVLHLACMK